MHNFIRDWKLGPSYCVIRGRGLKRIRVRDNVVHRGNATMIRAPHEILSTRPHHKRLDLRSPFERGRVIQERETDFIRIQLWYVGLSAIHIRTLSHHSDCVSELLSLEVSVVSGLTLGHEVILALSSVYFVCVQSTLFSYRI